MLDIKFIRENPEKIKEACRQKQVKCDIDRLLDLDKKRRELIQEIENLKAEQNKLSKNRHCEEPKFYSPSLSRGKILATKQSRDQQPLAEKENSTAQAKALKEKIKPLEPELKKIEEEIDKIMRQVPNLPLDSVPEGKDEKDNVVLREEGKKPKFDFQPKNYLKLAEKLDLIDIERAAKISGSRFGIIKGDLALMEFALIKLAFGTLTKEGFIPVVPPVLINSEMMEGTGHLSEKDKEEKYFIEKDKLYLAGSAEQPLVTMHAKEVFKEKDLPKRYLGFSTCFRREAGSYGKDTKGILRVHQFDKVEMVSFCKPDNSEKEHEFLLFMAEKLMQELKIPYRVVRICIGDLAFPAAAAYDIEAWLPGQNQYRETHSIFNDTDFQTRRLDIRYRRGNESKFAHALNSTAFAIGRTLIAIIENYQQKDGSIEAPEVLRKYMGKKKIR